MFNRLEKGGVSRPVPTPQLGRGAGARPKHPAKPTAQPGEKVSLAPFTAFARIRHANVDTGLVEAYLPFSALPAPGGYPVTPEALRAVGTAYLQRNANAPDARERVVVESRYAAVEFDANGMVLRAMLTNQRDRELAKNGGYQGIRLTGRVSRISGAEATGFELLQAELAPSETASGMSLYRAEGVSLTAASPVVVGEPAGSALQRGATTLDAEAQRLVSLREQALQRAEAEPDPEKRQGHVTHAMSLKQQLAVRGVFV